MSLKSEQAANRFLFRAAMFGLGLIVIRAGVTGAPVYVQAAGVICWFIAIMAFMCADEGWLWKFTASHGKRDSHEG